MIQLFSNLGRCFVPIVSVRAGADTPLASFSIVEAAAHVGAALIEIGLPQSTSDVIPRTIEVGPKRNAEVVWIGFQSPGIFIGEALAIQLAQWTSHSEEIDRQSL